MAFFAENPFVHVRIVPELRAVCSTGKLNVSPNGTVGVEMESKGLTTSREGLIGEPTLECSVRKASTESAR